MKKHENIFRIDIEPSDDHPNRHSTHGWQVRIRRQGEQHTKYFSDKRFGGKESALETALEHRDELLEELPEAEDPVRKSAEARSKTGVIGLNFNHKDDGSGNKKPYIQLSWLDSDGNRGSAAYSIKKWGFENAIWNACVRLHEERKQRPDWITDEEPKEMFETAHRNILKEMGETPPDTPPSPPTDKLEEVPAASNGNAS
jgi:hypothetical protein